VPADGAWTFAQRSSPLAHRIHRQHCQPTKQSSREAQIILELPTTGTVVMRMTCCPRRSIEPGFPGDTECSCCPVKCDPRTTRLTNVGDTTTHSLLATCEGMQHVVILLPIQGGKNGVAVLSHASRSFRRICKGDPARDSTIHRPKSPIRAILRTSVH
jgi:hypothetical protein